MLSYKKKPVEQWTAEGWELLIGLDQVLFLRQNLGEGNQAFWRGVHEQLTFYKSRTR